MVVYGCVFVILGVSVCMCGCVVFDFFLFLSVMLVLLHFVRNKPNSKLDARSSIRRWILARAYVNDIFDDISVHPFL